MKWIKNLFGPSKRELHRRLDINARANTNLLLDLHEALQENARLGAIITNPELVSLGFENGTVEMSFDSPVALKILAASFFDVLKDAKNWQSVEVGPMDHEGTKMIVTVRRMCGDSPEVTVGMLRGVIEDLLECVDQGFYPEPTRLAKEALNPQKKD